MEGLARWSQNITHSRKNRNIKLPKNLSELNELLTQAHEAEYFWRRLFDQVGNEKRFLRKLLENCRTQAVQLENYYMKASGHIAGSWSSNAKQSFINNKYFKSVP